MMSLSLPWVNPVAVWITLLVIAIGAAWIYRDANLRAPLPILTLAFVLALGYGVSAHDRDQARSAARGVARAAAVKAHDDCVQKVERSIGNRAMWVDLGSYLDGQGLGDPANVIRQLLDKNLPLLSLDDCPEAPA